MKTSIGRIVITLKSGKKRILTLVRENRKNICKLLGKFGLFIAKTLIETFFQDWL